ncbi:homocitrate synthase/isopropylmalate synthase family protein [Moorella sulfitireducens]|uniref:homocitrate synthase/isopropylmalate synthase family protein n=1 Tax=Neomoorella sulfitireducens TaxID=2972948 RepID=UPI0021ABFD99|nr:homoaconitate hydratase [Moorella sulfitireducens]
MEYKSSFYNFLPEIMGERMLRPDFAPKIYDTTLRDGEQTVNVNFDTNQKVEIALLLDEVGVGRIEAGLPVVSREDRKAVEIIASLNLKAEVWGFSRCVPSDVVVNAELGVKAIVCEIATSEEKLKAFGFSEESVLDKAIESLLIAKEKGLYTAFFAVDATRTRMEFLKKIYQTAVSLGKADEIVIPDTLGLSSPETIFYIVQKVQEWVPVPVHVHCHNDFGLATACSLAGLKAGARWVHVSVNGLGERSGNCDLAEIAMAAKFIYGIDLGINLQALKRLSKLVERFSGVPVSPQKPVVGDAIFKRDSGIVVTQLKKYPPAVEPYPPEIVGQVRDVVLSKKSGAHSVEFVLERLGLDATPEEINRMVALVKETALTKKRSLTDEEFMNIYKSVSQAAG